MRLTGKKILLGITGGIAAYKACSLIRLFVKSGAEVKAVLTPNALNFVTETTLRTLTRNPVFIRQFEEFEWKPEHISLADEADLFVIAPASANTISKIANGVCDNLLTSLISAFDKSVVFAPAMNSKMWNNCFVRQNVDKLIKAGYYMVSPDEGELACGYEGAGRLACVDDIYDKAAEILEGQRFLQGKRILVTAGGTKEPIDPVRYIGNRSSGKMGVSIADAAYNFGADVCLISTNKLSKPYKTIETPSAKQMQEAVISQFPSYDALFMAAAVSDYRVKEVAENKIKKDNDEINLELVKNPDILKEISKIKTPEQLVVGFCAETENLEQNALKKLEQKKPDFLVANDVSQNNTGFESDYNEVIIFTHKSNQGEKISQMPKTELAKLLLKRIFYDSNIVRKL